MQAPGEKIPAPAMQEKHLTNQKFTDFDLAPSLLRGLADLGFTHCTPIQALVLPPALAGRDVAGQAQTGTGKTAAFLLTLFNRLINNPQPPPAACRPRAVILAPTRELAIQIHKDAQAIGEYTAIRLGLVYGGIHYDKQREEIAAGVDVLTGTPGRLLDYYRQGVFGLDAVEVAVLDEADRMFDLGFIRDIRYVLRRMPPAAARQSMLFSATLSLRVNELAYEHMNSPQRLVVESATPTAEKIEESLFFPAAEEKIPLLVQLLRQLPVERCLVFVNTRIAADTVHRWLQNNGVDSGVLSGDIPQQKRERLLESFRAARTTVMVATDVAARGLHIAGVSHVINFDLPQDCEDYVHRVGRTARAGASGAALSFACDKYAVHLPEIENFIGRKIPRRPPPPGPMPTVQPPAARSARRPSPSPAAAKPPQRQPSPAPLPRPAPRPAAADADVPAVG